MASDALSRFTVAERRFCALVLREAPRVGAAWFATTRPYEAGTLSYTLKIAPETWQELGFNGVRAAIAQLAASVPEGAPTFACGHGKRLDALTIALARNEMSMPFDDCLLWAIVRMAVTGQAAEMTESDSDDHLIQKLASSWDQPGETLI